MDNPTARITQTSYTCSISQNKYSASIEMHTYRPVVSPLGYTSDNLGDSTDNIGFLDKERI